MGITLDNRIKYHFLFFCLLSIYLYHSRVVSFFFFPFCAFFGTECCSCSRLAFSRTYQISTFPTSERYAHVQSHLSVLCLAYLGTRILATNFQYNVALSPLRAQISSLITLTRLHLSREIGTSSRRQPNIRFSPATLLDPDYFQAGPLCVDIAKDLDLAAAVSATGQGEPCVLCTE